MMQRPHISLTLRSYSRSFPVSRRKKDEARAMLVRTRWLPGTEKNTTFKSLLHLSQIGGDAKTLRDSGPALHHIWVSVEASEDRHASSTPRHWRI